MFFLFLVLFACVAWYRRDMALAVVLFALPSYLVRFTVGPIPTTLLECMILILFFFWLVRDCRGVRGSMRSLRKMWTSSGKIERLLYASLLIFLFFATVSVFVSPSLRGSLGIWRAYFIEPALVFMVFLDVVRTKEQFRTILSALIASGTLVAFVAVYQRFTGWHIPAPWLLERRVTSFYGYPNAVGLYLAPIVFLVIGRFGEMIHSAGSSGKKALFHVKKIAVMLLCLSAIFFAKTWGAMVGMVCTSVTWALVWSKRSRMAVICIGIIAIVLIGLNAPHLSFVKDKLLLNAWSGKVRRVMWSETLTMLFDHKIFGAGLDGFQTVYVPYHKAKYFEIFLYPHDIVLNFWSETGLGGLLSFFAIVYFYFVLLLKVLRVANALDPDKKFFVRLYGFVFTGSMLTILIHGLVDVPYFKNDLSVFFWVLVAFAIWVHRYATSKEAE